MRKRNNRKCPVNGSYRLSDEVSIAISHITRSGFPFYFIQSDYDFFVIVNWSNDQSAVGRLPASSCKVTKFQLYLNFKLNKTTQSIPITKEVIFVKNI